jgi:TolB-like protein/DNA-binding winged helix-turn-helix (wHTH) protein/Flp pilus assembly protein TadD
MRNPSGSGHPRDKIIARLTASAAEGAHFAEAMPVPQSYRFGEFELNLDTQQLLKGGVAVRLERRPFDLLVMLVRNRERLVSREEIIAALWPGNVIIDFESGLNTLVRKVRNVLGDSPDEPRYIETIPGRGYRFVAPILDAQASVPVPPPVAAMESRRLPCRGPAALLALLALVGAIVTWQLTDSEPGPTRIAILPFENLTGSEELGYLAAGIAEDTNTSLARLEIPNLRLIGVVSARALAESTLPLQTIGQQLGVDYVVASSLRLEQSRIRVTSRLIRVSDSEQVWSAAFDRELTNLLGLQRELSIAIAEQIRQRLSPSVAAAIDARQTRNPEAYELYLRGRYEWTQFQPGSIPRALQYYRLAVERDPGYALAWAGIAHASITSVVTIEADRQSVRPASLDALQRALEYGPGLAETQLARGSFHFFMDRDTEAAEAAARQAVALDPNSAMSHMFLGIVLAEEGKHVEARAMLRRARELDPLFPLMFANSAVVSLMAGDPREAIEFATQAIAINPEFWVGYLHLGTAKLKSGDNDGAIAAFANAEKFSGNNSASASSGRARALVRLGHTDEAREILDDLVSRSASQNVPPYYIAVVHAALGEADPAFEWLQRGLDAGSVFCLEVETDQEFATLRADPRFESFLNRCRIADRRKSSQLRD